MRRPLAALSALGALVVWLAIPHLLPGRLSIFVLMALYIPIVIGLSLLAGFAGQISLGQAAFYGLGAYTSGVLAAHFGWNPYLTLPVAVAGTAAVAYVLGGFVLMLRGHYLVIATLGLNIIVVVLLRQLRGLTGGASGLLGIPFLTFGESALIGDRFFFYAGTALCVLALWLSRNLVTSRFGRALQAIESSETAAATLAINATRYKNAVFAWSAALAAASGFLYTYWVTFISPSPFDLNFSVLLLTMAVLGGIASLPGAVLGTIAVVLLREELQGALAGIGGGGSAEKEIVVFGILLAAIVIFLPQGLWPGLVHIARRLLPVSWTQPASDLPEAAELDLRVADPAHKVLEVEGLTRRFGGLTALRNLSFDVRAGEIFAVIGPNGAGKTTLLNLVSGVLVPTEGRIRIGAKDVTGLAPHRIAELGTARSFQTPRLFALLSVIDNVKAGVHRRMSAGFFRSALRLSAAEERGAGRDAMGALELVGARRLAGERVSALPFGAQRLIELARALVARPRLLLLDEPASGLSASERGELAALVRKVASRGVAVILVEHNVQLVSQLADRVLVIHHGDRIAMDSPDVVMQDAAVIEAYLGGEKDRAEATTTERRPAAAASRLLAIDDLHASYGAIKVLDGVDMDVAQGEVVAVLGRNGAGKTTLTRAVTGLLAARGRVSFEEQEILGMRPEKVASLGLSLVPERRQLLDTMTVEDNLRLGAYRRRKQTPAIGADLSSVYDLFPILAERRHQQARSLSGGQQQMLAIGRALMARPRLLLLDEPLLGLAPQVVDDILSAILTLRSEGIGLVVIEQNAIAVLPIVDRGYVLENGRVVMEDSAHNLLKSERLVEAFLGSDIGQKEGLSQAVPGERAGG